MKIVFMGTPQAAVPSLERCVRDGHDVVAVYTQPDRPSGRGNNVKFSPVKDFALYAGIEVRQPLKIRTSEAALEFSALGADIAVVVAYGRILPDAFLTAFPLGAVNVHFSLLPKFRGAAPVNWAIVEGETETGVTTMMMDAGLDTGEILMQESTVIGDTENATELMNRLSQMGAELLSNTLNNLDSIKPRSQNNDLATYAPIMRRDDGTINWNLSAIQINNRIRGFQPFPTAFSIFRGGRITLWNGDIGDFAGIGGCQPGQIVAVSGESISICCGDSSILEVTEIQPEGKRRMAVRDFINGAKPTVGEKFG